MRLKVWKYLEEEILGRRVDRTRLGRMQVERQPMSREDKMMAESVGVHTVVDYRVRIGARVNVRSRAQGEFDHARERVVKLLCHEMFDDLISEIYRTEEWAFEQGYDDEMLKALKRLADLAKGADALAQLEDVILTKMWESARGSEFGSDGIAFNLRFFEPLPREVVRGVLRHLRDKGDVQHMKALWSEDGEPRGAGYALTPKSVAAFKRLEEEDAA